MTRENIEQIVIEEARASQEPSYDGLEYTINSNLREDLSFDSLDDIELIVRLEYRFNMGVKDEELVSIKTISDIVDFIENKLKNK